MIEIINIQESVILTIYSISYSKHIKCTANVCVCFLFPCLKRFKLMGLHVIHPRVLRELHDAGARMLSIICEKTQRSGEIPED